MKRVKLRADKREPKGKSGARKLRQNDLIPAIIYGNEVEGTVPIAIDRKVLIHTVRPHEARNFIVDLEVDGTLYPTIIAEVQQNPVTEEPLHVDFYRISMDKPIHTLIPIVIEGSSPGEKEGGMLEHVLREISIVCLPGDLPDSITVDVSLLDMGDSIHVADIEPVAGVEFLTEEHDTVVHVRKPRIIEEEEEEELEIGELEGAEEGEEAATEAGETTAGETAE